MRTLAPLAAPVFTARAQRLAIEHHEHRAIAHGGRWHDHHGLGRDAAFDADSGFASARNATLAFISGRR